MKANLLPAALVLARGVSAGRQWLVPPTCLRPVLPPWRCRMIRRLMLSCFAGLFCGSLAPAQEQTLPKVTVELRAKAEKGDAMSQLFLGAAYANGSGVPTDEAEAVKWYRKAADQGYATAQNDLGFMYAHGLGVPKDEIEAYKWYRKAAEQGHAKAESNLGFMYDNGQGVPKDEIEAIKWYRKAAGQGEVKGQVFLGFMYDNGRGVPKDEAEAYKWYLLAGAQGDEDARKRYAILERVLTPAQREEGQRMARDFKPSEPR